MLITNANTAYRLATVKVDQLNSQDKVLAPVKVEQLNSQDNNKAKVSLLVTEHKSFWVPEIKLDNSSVNLDFNRVKCETKLENISCHSSLPAKVNTVNSKNLKVKEYMFCSKCNKYIKFKIIHAHCAMHLKKAKKIDTYFKCLLCNNSKKCLTFMTVGELKKHLLNKHPKNNDNRFAVGVDYLDKRDEYRHLLLAEIKTCFNYQGYAKRQVFSVSF